MNNQNYITMKKTITIAAIAALAAALFTACNKDHAGIPVQRISIGFADTQSGPMTKADQKAVSDAISATFPTGGVTFTLTSTKNAGRTYSVALGAEVVVPIDEYRVTCNYRPQEKARTYKNGIVYNEPRFSVDETINVTNLQSAYEVTAVYGCWCLVIDATDTKKYQHKGYSYDMEDFSWFVWSGDIGVAFISGTWTDAPYKIVAVPKEPVGHEEKSYNIVTDRNYEGVYVENGKWYCFGAAEVEDASGAISISFPAWTQGSTE